jgi:uncharacterized protein (TIGR00369 family)
LPPPAFVEMGGEIIDFEPKKHLRARFLNQSRFSNPMGVLQGGMFAAALDNVWGPLCYASTLKRCVTIELSVSFVKPLPPTETAFYAEAEIQSLGNTLIVLSGRVLDLQGRVLGLGSAHFLVLSERKG